ncbi:MAG: hypothetical protein ACQKBY_05340 [Verrucomicrobiales bacterium]
MAKGKQGKDRECGLVFCWRHFDGSARRYLIAVPVAILATLFLLGGVDLVGLSDEEGRTERQRLSWVDLGMAEHAWLRGKLARELPFPDRWEVAVPSGAELLSGLEEGLAPTRYEADLPAIALPEEPILEVSEEGAGVWDLPPPPPALARAGLPRPPALRIRWTTGEETFLSPLGEATSFYEGEELRYYVEPLAQGFGTVLTLGAGPRGARDELARELLRDLVVPPQDEGAAWLVISGKVERDED